MTDDFSIRMKDDDGIAPPASIFAPRPDRKGPKTIAILLILGSILMVVIGFGDIQNSMAEDFPDADLEPILENYQNQEIDITEEDYQEYHDEIRDNGAYSVRGYSLMIGGILVLVGGFMLFRLKLLGVKLAITGSLLGLIGGFAGTWMMVDVSGDILPKGVTEITRLMAYMCGVCMAICVALAALPILNSSARMALDEKVTLVNEEEIPYAGGVMADDMSPEEIEGAAQKQQRKNAKPEESNRQQFQDLKKKVEELAEESKMDQEEAQEAAGNTYNIQHISIQDSVVVDSVFTNNSEEE